MMGHSRFVWATFIKSRLVDDSRLLQREFMAHLESILMWRGSVLGVSIRAWWIARISPELFVCMMFLPTGAT